MTTTDLDPPTTPKPRGRRPQAVAEQTRAEVVAAARALFAERGVDAVGTRHIAAAAGVAHGLVRHHFGSKAGVWHAVVDAADAEFAAALIPLADAVDGGGRDVADFVAGFVDACARQPDIARLLVHEGTVGGERLDQLLERLNNARATFAPISARLRAAGRLSDIDDDEFLLLLLMAGMMPFGLPALTQGLLGRPLSPQRHAQLLVETLLSPQAFTPVE